MTNLTEHKCAGKCPEFKGEQCKHCLIDHAVQQHEMIDDPNEEDYSYSSYEELETYASKQCAEAGNAKKQVELLQTEVARLNDKVRSLESENQKLHTACIELHISRDQAYKHLESCENSLNYQTQRFDELSQKVFAAIEMGYAIGARTNFRFAWEKIYGQNEWNKNPWVWVVEFKVIEGGAA